MADGHHALLRHLVAVTAILVAGLLAQPAGAVCIITIEPGAGFVDADGRRLLYGCPRPPAPAMPDRRPEHARDTAPTAASAPLGAVARQTRREARVARALGQGYAGFRKVHRGQRYLGFRKVHRGQRYLGFHKAYSGPRYPSDLYGAAGRWNF